MFIPDPDDFGESENDYSDDDDDIQLNESYSTSFDSIFPSSSYTLSIDEMMVKYYGRCKLKQFIKSKPIRFGIKLWGLCSVNGYVFNFDIYCGKNEEVDKLSKYLLVHLKKIGLQATCKVRENRVSVTNVLEKKAHRDSKPVSILSTAAGITPQSNVNRYNKEEKKEGVLPFPNAFTVYNKYMGGVDLHD
ncbi:PREDICTED: piggyBac transposable element-derived protein 3-like, partial [Dinoponera quadriceps]|uniref:PiggyBac transposable element-derived protein 3-like n=1 Tax=Dinoponera quadriceps TaxID=609295 RepID=A0A6P3Y8L0_DINQU